MNTNRNLYILLAALLAFLIAIIVWYYRPLSVASKAVQNKLKREKEVEDQLHFSLADPGQAPIEIRDIVKLGYQIMLHTPEKLPQYVGDRLSCTHCHFAGGDTTGGKNGGISLAGSAAIYPKFDKRAQRVIDLPTRINLCFENSMNGKPLPLDSREMLGLVAYLQWISRSIPVYQQVPWLDVPRIEKSHVPDSQKGKAIYQSQCALCHGNEGQGEVHNQIPPVWGPKSFNDRAGMNQEEVLASFIYYNMPYTDATLTTEEAWDVAAFITSQPRPKKSL